MLIYMVDKYMIYCAAALELNRNFIGIEIEKKYFTAAKKRLTQIQSSLFV